ncbi:MAG: HTH domain-containing protein, partial [Bacteroidetes bacterium]|nr:HTH domain-containing protein [Bacteroidota bacterium]
MNNHKTLYRLFQLIVLLKQSTGYPVERLAQRFETTTRTIYRYFELLRDCGFQIEKTSHHYYYIKSAEQATNEPFAGFTMEEATVLRQALLALYPKHPLKAPLLKKLQSLTDLEQLAEVIYDQMLAQNIRKLAEGIR